MFGMFSKGGSLKRAQKKALNKYAQTVERMAALERLVAEGDDESLLTVAKRFNMTCIKGVDDEEEKAWVVRTFTAMGEQILPTLERYMETHATIAYPLRVLEDVASPQRAMQIIDKLLAKEEPGYVLDTSKRISLFTWVAEQDDLSPQEASKRIAPYLADFDESVRFAAVEALDQKPCVESLDALIEALMNEDEESRRFKARILEFLAEHEIPLGDHKKPARTLVLENFPEFRVPKDTVKKK